MNHSEKKYALLSGDEALARGAWEAGVCFASAYPGTPSTEILETLAFFKEVNSQWSVNEKVAYEVAYGAAVGGVRALYASKHVGVNVAMDPLMTSAYTGINAGFVLVTADDPGLHSSQNEQDNRLIAKFAKIPLLEPSSPSEAKEFIKIAFELSEQYDIPVMVRLTTRVAHTKENVELLPRKEVKKKDFKIDIAKYVMIPKNAFQRHLDLEKRLVLLKKEAEQTPLNHIEINDTQMGIITSSVAYLYAKEAFPHASFLKLGMSYPFAEEKIKTFASKVKNLFVIEELEPFLEEEVARLGLTYVAKHSSWRVGELRPEDMQQVIQQKERIIEPSTTRKPVMCPGCPHRGVYSILKKLNLVVAGDIGCYSLGATPPLSSLHTCLCMGAGVTVFEGFRKTLDKNVVGVIGDSTFIHSGITGLINAAYNKTTGVLLILDNSTTAMTGTQENPSTGKDIYGKETKKIILEDIVKACGVDYVDVINAYDIHSLEKKLKERLEEKALSVIITRAPCRLIHREKKTIVHVDTQQCKKCGLCLNIACPALTKNNFGTIEIEPSLCVGCHVCVAVCKFNALKTS